MIVYIVTEGWDHEGEDNVSVLSNWIDAKNDVLTRASQNDGVDWYSIYVWEVDTEQYAYYYKYTTKEKKFVKYSNEHVRIT